MILRKDKNPLIQLWVIILLSVIYKLHVTNKNKTYLGRRRISVEDCWEIEEKYGATKNNKREKRGK